MQAKLVTETGEAMSIDRALGKVEVARFFISVANAAKTRSKVPTHTQRWNSWWQVWCGDTTRANQSISPVPESANCSSNLRDLLCSPASTDSLGISLMSRLTRSHLINPDGAG